MRKIIFMLFCVLLCGSAAFAQKKPSQPDMRYYKILTFVEFYNGKQIPTYFLEVSIDSIKNFKVYNDLSKFKIPKGIPQCEGVLFFKLKKGTKLHTLKQVLSKKGIKYKDGSTVYAIQENGKKMQLPTAYLQPLFSKDLIKNVEKSDTCINIYLNKEK